MESLGGIDVFVQVAETRSFVSAGRLLGLSASAVGKNVARLEGKLGVRLFHRSTRSITLTAEGLLFLERCRRIIAEIEAAHLELSQASSKPSGRLRLSLPLVSSLMLPVLGDFMCQYPEINLDLDFTDDLVDVIEEGFDAVIRTGEPADSRLSARRLGYYSSRLVASPVYLKDKGLPQHPVELLQHVCLHYRFSHTGKLEKWPLRHTDDLALPVSMVCNNIETRLCFALRGLGIAWLPDFAVRDCIAEGSLVSVLDEFIEWQGTFHILWPASKHTSPKIRVLVDFLTKRFSNTV